MKQLLNQMDEFSRRDVMTRAAQTCLGVGLAPMIVGGGSSVFGEEKQKLKPVKQKAESVIYLYMSGGMSHLDTFDPKPGTEVQGPTESIKTKADGVIISEHFGRTAKWMDKAVLVRSMNSKQGAHQRANYFMHTSYAPIATTRHPAMGSWVMKLAGRKSLTLPGNVLIGGGSGHPGGGFMESRYSPLPIGDPATGLQNSKLPAGVTQKQFDKRMKLMKQFDRSFTSRFPHKSVKGYSDFYREAIRLMKSEDLKAFDISTESEKTREMYGEDRFAQGCLLARRLVERGVRFVEVNFGGWDTHQDNFERLPDKAAVLDQALAGLLSDLESRGLLKTTMVVVASEFGRTPKVNDRQGRDHHPRVFTCMLAGAGVKGGYVYGASDDKGYKVAEKKASVQDFNATIAYGMGLPLDKVIMSPSGRPFTVAHKGKPIADIYS